MGLKLARSDLHWLPLEQRIIFKLCSLMHRINTDHSPQYLRELVSLTSDIASRSRLRSATSRRYELPAIRLKFGERCFSFAGTAWNSLPTYKQYIPYHQALNAILKLNYLTVRTRRKTYLLCVTYGVSGALEKT